jgi:hypothetical protein
MNRWNYVEGNPINLVDYSGRNPNCPENIVGSACALERLNEIVEESNGGLHALVKSFDDLELQNNWGKYAGNSSGERLEWLLSVTQNSAPLEGLPYVGPSAGKIWIPFHFKIYFGSDCDFASEFRDSQYYDTWNKASGGRYSGSSNQVGHFLTAVSISFYHWDRGFIIGHEKVSDTDTLGNLSSNYSVTGEEFNLFYDAIEYDRQDLDDKRDASLLRILNFDERKLQDGIDPTRAGNSLEDFRLSLKGVRFADWVGDNYSAPSFAAAAWLNSELGTDYSQ